MTAQESLENHRITVAYNPATGQEIGQVTETDLGRMPEIMDRARAAQRIWREYTYKERAREILKMRRYIVDHAEELAEIVSKSNGKTLTDALATEVLPCSMACDWYAKNASKVLATRSRRISSVLFFNKRNQISYVPLGVVGIISPWNYPLSIPFGEIVMGLMAGNAVLLKVAAATPLVGKAIERIVAAADLPNGLFQHLVGSGGAVSDAFLDQGVDKLFFTGSVPVGRQLMGKAAKTLTPVSLELGGNDAMLVFEDADLERAANGAAWAGYQNAGQSCGGVERVYVQRSVYDEFLALLKQKTQALRHGVGQSFAVDIGCLTTKKQLQTVEQHLKDAVEKGAIIEAQSSPVGDQAGFFHPATLLTGTTRDMDTIQQETFGPLLPVMPFDTEAEAIAQANDSDLALTSSVWTGDLKRGKRVALRLETGVTTINDHLYTHGLSEMPWGGWKQSGIGRTHGPEGLMEMTHAKAINYDLLPAKRNLWWYPMNKNTYQALLRAQRFVFGRNIGEKLLSGTALTPFLVGKMFTRWKLKSKKD